MNQNNSKENNNINNSNVAPTDLRNTDIEMFGQENIPIMNMNRMASITDFDITSKNSEFNNIGTVPPGSYTEKVKKKNINFKQFSFIVLIFIVIAIIGGGLYFYLSSTRKVAENAVLTKTVEVNVGEKLPLILDKYAEFRNVKATNCILNTKEVEINKIGTYTYTISCGVNDYKGTIRVVDKKAPEVETKVLFKTIAEELDVNEFIVSCNDYSECVYSLINFDELKDKMKNEGVYEAEIEVSDKEKNKVTIREILIVSQNKPEKTLNCNYKELDLKNYEGTYQMNEMVNFKDNYANLLITKTTFVFEKVEEYNDLKNQVNESNILTIENTSGTPLFENDKLSITLVSINETSKDEFFGSSYYDDAEEYYDLFGYTCQLY